MSEICGPNEAVDQLSQKRLVNLEGQCELTGGKQNSRAILSSRGRGDGGNRPEQLAWCSFTLTRLGLCVHGGITHVVLTMNASRSQTSCFSSL